ncbi:hypothetical protein CCR97_09110 [Rhodoplanes elegans]|uniref:Uncharacterized protein n=1 Tax=Rhodoplanes elegans TaxID=29408 RepID=A0A327KLK0_9BRAD|nr:hypothetical protein [Rhodoplanes elegans]MBK5958368.1 hypothetical protein [Rhodoplanes elegans]RAI39740.1 hypothetical protein CH338_08430 [Rhodoplanes elegans]
MSSLIDDLNEQIEGHFKIRGTAKWQPGEATVRKLDRMCAAYHRHAADFGLPDMPDDVLRDAAKVILAGLDGREPQRRLLIKHT